MQKHVQKHVSAASFPLKRSDLRWHTSPYDNPGTVNVYMIKLGTIEVASLDRFEPTEPPFPPALSDRSSAIDPAAPDHPPEANANSASSGTGVGSDSAIAAGAQPRDLLAPTPTWSMEPTHPSANHFAGHTQSAHSAPAYDATAHDAPAHDVFGHNLLANNPKLPSFEEIVRQYQRDVRLYVARFLGRHAAVDDVAQEVFVQVYRSLDQFAGRSPLKAWIFGIARNCVGTWFRQQNRQIRFRSLDLDLDLAQFHWQKSHATQASESETVAGVDSDTETQLATLRGCLAKLKPPQRALVQQFYFEQVTAESIAQQQGRGAGAIRMALLRIREALAKCVRQQLARRSTHE